MGSSWPQHLGCFFWELGAWGSQNSVLWGCENNRGKEGILSRSERTADSGSSCCIYGTFQMIDPSAQEILRTSSTSQHGQLRATNSQLTHCSQQPSFLFRVPFAPQPPCSREMLSSKDFCYNVFTTLTTLPADLTQRLKSCGWAAHGLQQHTKPGASQWHNASKCSKHVLGCWGASGRPASSLF